MLEQKTTITKTTTTNNNKIKLIIIIIFHISFTPLLHAFPSLHHLFASTPPTASVVLPPSSNHTSTTPSHFQLFPTLKPCLSSPLPPPSTAHRSRLPSDCLLPTDLVDRAARLFGCCEAEVNGWVVMGGW